jgi:RNA polymerase sigma-70 factor, ECF subfamily
MQLRRRGAVTCSLDQSTDEGGKNEAIEVPDPGPTPEQSYSLNEVQSFLASALDLLHPKLRIVFLLHLEGCTGKETAEILGVSLEAAKTRLFRARQILRTQLNRLVSPSPTPETRSQASSIKRNGNRSRLRRDGMLLNAEHSMPLFIVRE